MHLKKLEISGFKSFAKKTVLTFEPGITSVVGPNGSGKSNIADSLRWAFGEQSMKLLRGRKNEDVIFAGSDQKARLGAAEVFVHFDNSDHNIPVDYDEVVIGRRLFRDGTSEYLVNNTKVRLLDIQDLLSKSGFGSTSYHVIGQGAIDQLILGGPAAIKELIEEAAGIRPYYIKRERALKRLLATDTNLEQVRALLAEIEPRLKSLRRQTKRLERRDELERELAEVSAVYYGSLFSGLKRQNEELAEKIKWYDKQIDELNTEIAKLSQEIEAEEKNTVKTSETQGSKKVELEKLRQEKQKILEQQAILRGEMALLSEQKIDAGIDLRAMKARLQEIYKALRTFFERIDKFESAEARAIEFTAVDENFQSVLKEFEGGQQSRSEKIEGLEKKLSGLSDNLAALSKKIDEIEQELMLSAQNEGGNRKQLFVKERLLRTKQDALLKIRDEKNNLAVEQARLETRGENYIHEAKEVLGGDYQDKLKEPSGPVPSGLVEKIARLKKELAAIGGIDDLTLQEYQETEKRYGYLKRESEDLDKAAADLQNIIKELDEVIKKDFSEALGNIGERFAEYFRELFGGGRATMSPVKEKIISEEKDLEEEIEEQLIAEKRGEEIVGIQINATPPGKKLSGIAALSGGERALTSIALLSAMLACFPSPFVVLDEVDAALDEANSIRFGKILGTIAHQTQFITITHNRETMRQSHTLYGVTMGEDGVSRLLSLKLEEAAAYSTKN